MAGIRSSRQVGSDQPVERVFKPSKEVGSKMRPLSANDFHGLLRRAATQLVSPPHPKAK
jgi:hypothetical protein